MSTLGALLERSPGGPPSARLWGASSLSAHALRATSPLQRAMDAATADPVLAWA